MDGSTTIGANLAIKIGRATGTSPALWTGLQSAYDARVANVQAQNSQFQGFESLILAQAVVAFRCVEIAQDGGGVQVIGDPFSHTGTPTEHMPSRVKLRGYGVQSSVLPGTRAVWLSFTPADLIGSINTVPCVESVT